MINKCFKLMKIQLRGIIFSGQFGTKRGQKASKIVAMSLVLALIAFIFIFYSGFFTFAYILMGMEETVMPLMMTVASVMILFTTMFKANNFIFCARDNDLLMSLPVKNWTIIVSRFGSLYIYEELITAIIMLPALAVYTFLCGPGAMFVLAVLVSVLFIPLIPLALATLIGIVITFIAARFRYKNFVTMVLGAAAFLAVMYYSFSFSSVDTDKLVQINTLILELVSKLYPPVALYSMGLLGSVFAYAGYLLVSVAVAGVIIALIAWRFNRLTAALTSHKTKGNFKMTRLKAGTVFGALLVKEFKRYFSSTIYVLNTGLIYVLVIAAAIVIFFIKDIDTLINIPGASSLIGIFIPLIISFFAGITSTTSASLSLEGNKLWLLTSFPVKSSTIFNAKIAMNLILGLPCIIFAAIMCIIRFQLDAVWGLMTVVIPVLYTFLAAVGGMYVNIRFPNFTWTNEAAVVKQSAATMVTVFGGMILVIIPGAALFFLGIPALWTYGITAVVLLALNIIFYINIVKTPLLKFCSE